MEILLGKIAIVDGLNESYFFASCKQKDVASLCCWN